MLRTKTRKKKKSSKTKYKLLLVLILVIITTVIFIPFILEYKNRNLTLLLNETQTIEVQSEISRIQVSSKAGIDPVSVFGTEEEHFYTFEWGVDSPILGIHQYLITIEEMNAFFNSYVEFEFTSTENERTALILKNVDYRFSFLNLYSVPGTESEVYYTQDFTRIEKGDILLCFLDNTQVTIIPLEILEPSHERSFTKIIELHLINGL